MISDPIPMPSSRTRTIACVSIRGISKQLELAQLKSEFVATVSHELRTPLTSIRYLLDLLQMGRVPDEQKKQQYYATLTGEADRLSHLVENILDFSRIEAGVKKYTLSWADTGEFTEKLAFRFQALAREKGFILQTGFARPLPRAELDADTISRALGNIFDNALKYSGASTEITFSATAGEGVIHWEIADHGIEIPESDRERIFEKFYRIDHGPGTAVRGSGIGLSIVKHVADAHRGQVIVDAGWGKEPRSPSEYRSGWNEPPAGSHLGAEHGTYSRHRR
jgi:two-component system, OmpR family, phosphate regulon sensor histidine kinase PhoR